MTKYIFVTGGVVSSIGKGRYVLMNKTEYPRPQFVRKKWQNLNGDGTLSPSPERHVKAGQQVGWESWHGADRIRFVSHDGRQDHRRHRVVRERYDDFDADFGSGRDFFALGSKAVWISALHVEFGLVGFRQMSQGRGAGLLGVSDASCRAPHHERARGKRSVADNLIKRSYWSSDTEDERSKYFALV